MMLESVKLKEERQLFFAIENETRDYGCIGHLRGDFGSGKEFWTTWFPHTCHELNDEHFKTIFDAVINELRSEGQHRDSVRQPYYTVRSLQQAAQLQSGMLSYLFNNYCVDKTDSNLSNYKIKCNDFPHFSILRPVFKKYKL